MPLAITIGCPGAGKSTWAELAIDPMTLRLERDRFREAIFGSRRAYHESEIEREVRSYVVTSAMLAAMDTWPKRDWAVTDTGLDFDAVQPFIEAARDYREPITLFVFDRPLGLLLDRNLKRDEAHRVPPEILQERFAAFQNPSAWWRMDKYTKVMV